MNISSRKPKLKTKEGERMIVMDLKIDNFMLFKNFHMNMSYPKKIVDSGIEGEFLSERRNFRYKKVNILMGANAVGKTSIGKMLMSTFNFVSRGKVDGFLEKVGEKDKRASLTIDFVDWDYNLNRVDFVVEPQDENNSFPILKMCTRIVEIGKKDNYEICAKKLDKIPLLLTTDIDSELEKIELHGWMFGYSGDSNSGKLRSIDYDNYPKILDYTLRALDPSIVKVEKLSEVKDSYVIRMKMQDFIIQDGEVIKNEILSSGTKAGIDVARMISGICEGSYQFYYCDELFSYVHSDVEKAFLSVMINQLGEDHQLFFTTHNSDILDMQLPKHAFCFLKKDLSDENEPIKCVEASKYLKRNTDSLRNAVENDLFSTAPNLELIYEIEEI